MFMSLSRVCMYVMGNDIWNGINYARFDQEEIYKKKTNKLKVHLSRSKEAFGKICLITCPHLC
uniref:Uncharacterized protein n=1 Tax=Octopus bimaculoides TaxID=37653 RepID=A0A0L8GY32_OCTBM